MSMVERIIFQKKWLKLIQQIVLNFRLIIGKSIKIRNMWHLDQKTQGLR